MDTPEEIAHISEQIVESELQGVANIQVRKKMLKKRIAAVIQAERDRATAELDKVREAVGIAYQFCAARGANTDLLDNLSAIANHEEAPHAEWPIETGTWKWEQCGHEAETACGKCLAGAREDTARLIEALRKIAVWVPTVCDVRRDDRRYVDIEEVFTLKRIAADALPVAAVPGQSNA